MGLPATKEDRIYTYRDYVSWPDDQRWELIHGVAWNMSPAPMRMHQKVLGNLHVAFRIAFDESPCEVYLAAFDVFFPDHVEQDVYDVTTVVQPDISVICDSSKLIDRGCFGPPDLVLEILSPYTQKKDLNEKFGLYEDNGVSEYWVVDRADKTIQVFKMGANRSYDTGEIFESGQTAASTTFPHLTVNLLEVFE